MACDDAGDDVGEVGVRVDAVEFRGLCRTANYAERHGQAAPIPT